MNKCKRQKIQCSVLVVAGNGRRDRLDGWEETDGVLGGREKGSQWWKDADGVLGGREG